MKRIVLLLTGMLIACNGVRAFIIDEEIFSRFSVDSLAPRDDNYLLHQMPAVRATDYAYRDSRRWVYYFKTNEQLMADPAYVAALQRDLNRLGYYCGRVDGVFSDEVSFAIARLQKNYSMRVTGELNGPVRRALHLP
jgi:peptidoglycan hydrolase-like protein with peptidoglycan-binding domain